MAYRQGPESGQVLNPLESIDGGSTQRTGGAGPFVENGFGPDPGMSSHNMFGRPGMNTFGGFGGGGTQWFQPPQEPSQPQYPGFYPTQFQQGNGFNPYPQFPSGSNGAQGGVPPQTPQTPSQPPVDNSWMNPAGNNWQKQMAAKPVDLNKFTWNNNTGQYVPGQSGSMGQPAEYNIATNDPRVWLSQNGSVWQKPGTDWGYNGMDNKAVFGTDANGYYNLPSGQFNPNNQTGRLTPVNQPQAPVDPVSGNPNAGNWGQIPGYTPPAPPTNNGGSQPNPLAPYRSAPGGTYNPGEGGKPLPLQNQRFQLPQQPNYGDVANAEMEIRRQQNPFLTQMGLYGPQQYQQQNPFSQIRGQIDPMGSMNFGGMGYQQIQQNPFQQLMMGGMNPFLSLMGGGMGMPMNGQGVSGRNPYFAANQYMGNLGNMQPMQNPSNNGIGMQPLLYQQQQNPLMQMLMGGGMGQQSGDPYGRNGPPGMLYGM